MPTVSSNVEEYVAPSFAELYSLDIRTSVGKCFQFVLVE